MRGTRAGMALLLAGAAWAAVTSPASARLATRIAVTSDGAIVVTWHGDPASGCQAKGICGYSGTYALPLTSDGQSLELVTGPRTENPGIDLSADQPGVTRVRRDGSGGAGTCVDLPRPGLSDLSLDTGPDGRLHAGGGLPIGDLTGRCAGPLPSDLPPDFLSGPEMPGSVGRTPVTLDFSGRTAYSSGGWSGEIVSTLKVTLTATPARASDREPRPPLVRGGVRAGSTFQSLDLTYRVEHLDSTFAADFVGRGDPACLPFDACGTGGTGSYSGAPSHGVVEILAERRLRPGEPTDLRSALRALRRGSMAVDGQSDVSGPGGQVTTVENLPDGTRCMDSTSVPPPGLDIAANDGALVFELSDAGIDADLLRTRCPGPLFDDVFSAGVPMARTRLPLTALGRRVLRIAGQDEGGFGSQAYVGRRRASMAFVLRRTRASVKMLRGATAP